MESNQIKRPRGRPKKKALSLKEAIIKDHINSFNLLLEKWEYTCHQTDMLNIKSRRSSIDPLPETLLSDDFEVQNAQIVSLMETIERMKGTTKLKCKSPFLSESDEEQKTEEEEEANDKEELIELKPNKKTRENYIYKKEPISDYCFGPSKS